MQELGNGALMSTVYMFLPDGSMKQRKDKVFAVLPHGTVVYLKGHWYMSFFNNSLVPMNTRDLPAHVKVWCLLMDIKVA